MAIQKATVIRQLTPVTILPIFLPQALLVSAMPIELETLELAAGIPEKFFQENPP